MNLDEILFYVGDFGKFQKLIICLILLPAVFPCGFHAYNQLFMATNPKNFWCNMPENFSNNQSNNKCIIYDTKEMTTVQCRSGWSYEIDDIRNSVISEWDLVCAHNFAPTLSLILFGCSGLMGNYIFGYIQDSFGRKPSYYIYLLIQCIFGIATSLANNYTIWTIFRMGVGFTVPAILGTPYVLAIELVGPNDRTTVTILINIAYSVSLILLAIIVWAIRSWRILALSTTLPFFGLFFTWFWLPESPRWLLSQGKYKEVKELLRKIGRINNRKLPENLLNKLEQPINNHNHNISINRKYGIKDLFHKKNLRWKTIIITGLWFTNISVYVGLSYYAPSLGGDEYLNFFLAGAVELPTYLFLWPAMEKLGRRWTLCLSMIIGGTSCLGTFLVQNDYTLTLILYCIGKMGISSAFVVLPLMASELYPTVVRGLGMSLSSVVGMLGPIFIPLVNYLGSDIIILPLIIMGIMLVIGGFSALLLPETLHQHLPQTLEDAEITGLKFFASCSLPQKEPSSSTLNEENKF